MEAPQLRGLAQRNEHPGEKIIKKKAFFIEPSTNASVWHVKRQFPFDKKSRIKMVVEKNFFLQTNAMTDQRQWG